MAMRCDCASGRCGKAEGGVFYQPQHGIACVREVAGADAMLTAALSGRAVRQRLDPATAEVNLRIAAQIMVVDVGMPQALAALRAILEELEMMVQSVVLT